MLHYSEENSKIFSPYIMSAMSNSSIILLVLSDQYILNEWNNKELREHLRHLIAARSTRFVAVQLHDVCDEEVEEYFRAQLQIPRLDALEVDELLFWQKLHYHLFTNGHHQARSVMPVMKHWPLSPSPVEKATVDAKVSARFNETAKKKSAQQQQLPEPRANEDIEFEKYDFYRPIVHLDGVRDPYSVSNPQVAGAVKQPSEVNLDCFRLKPTPETIVIGGGPNIKENERRPSLTVFTETEESAASAADAKRAPPPPRVNKVYVENNLASQWEVHAEDAYNVAKANLVVFYKNDNEEHDVTGESRRESKTKYKIKKRGDDTWRKAKADEGKDEDMWA